MDSFYHFLLPLFGRGGDLFALCAFHFPLPVFITPLSFLQGWKSIFTTNGLFLVCPVRVSQNERNLFTSTIDQGKICTSCPVRVSQNEINPYLQVLLTRGKYLCPVHFIDFPPFSSPFN